MLTLTSPLGPDITTPVLYQTIAGVAVPGLPVQPKMCWSFLFSPSICIVLCQTTQHIKNNMRNIKGYR